MNRPPRTGQLDSSGLPTATITRELVSRIREAEAVSRRLEPGAATRAAVRDRVVAYGETFLASLPDRKCYEIDKTAAREIRRWPIEEGPADVDRVLDVWARCVDEPGINPASAGHVGYIPGGGQYYAALGDYLAAVTNRYVGVRFAGPGAVEMENSLLDWMRDLVGYPEGYGGVLVSGGSVANLVAIVAAREAHALRASEYERAVVYASGHVHHCVDKALRVVGLGDCVRREIDLDDRYRMDPGALEGAIAEDRAAGLRPWLVIATAGTTDVGAIDPLDEVGRIAAANECWYHIDAAYGGFFALVPECRGRLQGMESSDSIVLDPHKGLFLPYGTGAVLARDKRTLLQAYALTANYMQDTLAEEARERTSPADLSHELSRHFRGPRVWLPLKLLGVEPFRACLEEKRLLTLYFHQRVRELGFEVGPEPDLSVSTYRYVPERGDPNAFNLALTEELHRDGRIFVSTTTMDGAFTLRMCALAFRTRLETVDLLLQLLADNVARLSETMP